MRQELVGGAPGRGWRPPPARQPSRPPSPLLCRADNNFVGKGVILAWLNSTLQLRLERIEDVSHGGGGGRGRAADDGCGCLSRPLHVPHTQAAHGLHQPLAQPPRHPPPSLPAAPRSPPADVQRRGGVPDLPLPAS